MCKSKLKTSIQYNAVAVLKQVALELLIDGKEGQISRLEYAEFRGSRPIIK